MKNRKKGIYCIGGLWEESNIMDKSSVEPILQLLEKKGTCDNIYHDCSTKEELNFLLKKWKPKYVNEKFPILYLAFHGFEGGLNIGNNSVITLDELGEFLEDSCIGKVIYFGSCLTLKIDKRLINSFLEKTGAIAAIGYTETIDWMKSAACDLFVFEALQEDKLDSKGVEKIQEKIISEYGNLHKILGLRFIINERIHFPRKRI